MYFYSDFNFNFAKKYESWTVEDWGQVMSSCESTFQQFVVRKGPRGKRFKEKYTLPSAHSETSRNQMDRGSMSNNETAGLFFTCENDSKWLTICRPSSREVILAYGCP